MLSYIVIAPLSIERLHGHENEVAIAFVDSVTRRQLKSKRGIDVQGDMTHRESHLPRLCSYDKEEYFLCSSVPCDDEDDEGPCDESPPHHQLLLWGENGTGYDDLLPFRGTELAENLPHHGELSHMNKAFYVYLYRRPIEERAIKRPQRHDDEGVHLFRVPKSQLRDDDHPASHLLGGLGQVRVAFLPNGVEFAWKFLFMPRDQLKRRVQEGTVLPRGGQDEL